MSEGAHEEVRPGALRRLTRSWVGMLLLAILLALGIKSFVAQAFYIPSESMLPTLRVGDRVLVNRLAYRFREPDRGDVVVFERGGEESERGLLGAALHWLTEGLGVSRSSATDYIKRVIGLPGETVEVRDGRVRVNSILLREPYADLGGPDYGARPVPAGRLFVLGDNRANSADSRVIGFVPLDDVVGEAVVIFWPPSNAGSLRGRRTAPGRGA